MVVQSQRLYMIEDNSTKISYRYWRVLCRNVDNTLGDPKVAEIEFRNVIGGSNLVGSGTAFNAYESGTISRAFDGDPNTHYSMTWYGGDDYSKWFGYDFGVGNEFGIIEVAIQAAQDASGKNQPPKDFNVEASDDGVIWTLMWAVDDEPLWADGENRVFTKP